MRIPSSRELIRAGFVLGCVALGFVLVARTAKVLLILFAGLLLGLLLHAAARFVSKLTRLSHVLALTAVVVAMTSATAALVVFFGPRLLESVRQGLHALPETMEALRGKLRLGNAPLAPADLLSAGKHVADLGVAAFSAIIVTLFLAVFGAAQPGIYRKALLELAPKDRERALGKVLDAITNDLMRWLLGRLVAMVFMGVSAYVAFRLLKIPMPAFLALLTGLLAFVEYLGAFVAAVPPTLLALLQGPGHVAAVLVVYTVLHVCEGYVLTPLLARATARVPPAGVLAGPVIMGALLGPIALTFSTPLIVVGISAVKTLRVIRDEDSLVGRSLPARSSVSRPSHA